MAHSLGFPEATMATKFETVELDNTFYRTPALSTVESWNTKDTIGIHLCCKSAASCHARKSTRRLAR